MAPSSAPPLKLIRCDDASSKRFPALPSVPTYWPPGLAVKLRSIRAWPFDQHLYAPAATPPPDRGEAGAPAVAPAEGGLPARPCNGMLEAPADGLGVHCWEERSGVMRPSPCHVPLPSAHSLYTH